MNLSGTGSQLVQNGLARLDETGVFDSGTVTPPGLVYDENGYPEEDNVELSDVNPLTDFTLVWSDEYNGWEITEYLNYSDLTVVIPSKGPDENPIVRISSAEGTEGWDVGAFEGLEIESVVLPNTIKSIGKMAFSFNNLTSITIPDSVVRIEEMAFADNLINNMYIPSTVSVIEGGAFVGNQMPVNKALIYASGTDNKTITSYAGAANANLDFVVPNGVTTIERNAFGGSVFKTLTLPNTLKTIGLTSFAGINISTLTIPASVTDIQSQAFAFSALTKVNFLGPKPGHVGFSIFFNCSGIGNNSLTVPDMHWQGYRDNAAEFGNHLEYFTNYNNEEEPH